MHTCLRFTIMFLVLTTSLTALAQERGLVKPELVLSKILEGMPKGEKQEVRILLAKFKPGEKTAFHTHRFPVALYILEGSFTVEKEGSAPETVDAGEATVMPAHVKMTAYNRSNRETLRVVVFYVSEPGTPFVDPIH